MTEKKINRRKLIGNSINILLLSLVILIVFVPGVKAWTLRQLIMVGLFKASMDGVDRPASKEVDLSFAFKDSNGTGYSIHQYKGKVVFINFWASWCPPCLAEMPSLQELYNECKKDKEIVFLFINEDGLLQKGLDYMQRNKFSMPVFSLTSQPPPALYTGTLPTTIVLDKQGRIVFKEEGIANYNTIGFIRQLRSLQLE